MTEDERAIRSVVETWIAASKAGDLATVLDLMADDVIFLAPGQTPFGKEKFAAASRSMTKMRFDGRADIQEIEVLGDRAFLRNYIEATITPEGGQPIRHAGHTLTILRKREDGRWVVARDANLVMAA